MLTISTNSWHFRFIERWSDRNVLAIPSLCAYIRCFLGACFKIFMILLILLAIIGFGLSGLFGIFLMFSHPVLIFGVQGSTHIGKYGYLFLPMLVDFLAFVLLLSYCIVKTTYYFIVKYNTYTGRRYRRNIQPNTNSIVYKSKSILSHVYNDFHKKTCTIIKFRNPDPDHPELG